MATARFGPRAVLPVGILLLVVGLGFGLRRYESRGLAKRGAASKGHPIASAPHAPGALWRAVPVWGSRPQPPAPRQRVSPHWGIDKVYGEHRPSPVEGAPPTAFALSDDGNTLVVGSRRDLYVWNVPGARLERIIPVAGGIRYVTVGPHGREALIRPADYEPDGANQKLWRLSLREPAAQPVLLSEKDPRFEDGAYSPDGKWVVASGSGRVEAFNRATHLRAWSVPVKTVGLSVVGLVISPDSKWLFFSTFFHGTWRLTALELSTGRVLAHRELSKGVPVIRAAAIRPDGRSVRLLDASGGGYDWFPSTHVLEQHSPPGFPSSVRPSYLSPDGSLVGSGKGSSMEVWPEWTTRTPAASRVDPRPPGLVRSASKAVVLSKGARWGIVQGCLWNPHGLLPSTSTREVVALAGTTKGVVDVERPWTLAVWGEHGRTALRDHTFVQALAVHDDDVVRAIIGPASDTGPSDLELVDIDLETGSIEKRSSLARDLLDPMVAFGPRGDSWAISSQLRTGSRVAVFGPGGKRRLTLPADGKAVPAGKNRLAVFTQTTVSLIEAASGKVLWRTRVEPEGTRPFDQNSIVGLVVCAARGEIWAVRELRSATRLSLASGRVLQSVSFEGWDDDLHVSPDGSRVATIGRDGVLDLSGPTGAVEDVLRFDHVLARPTAIAWGPKGKTLFVGTGSGTIYRLHRK